MLIREFTLFGKKLKLDLNWAWFDFWIGLYYDRKKKILYFCPLPTVVLSFSGQKTKVIMI